MSLEESTKQAMGFKNENRTCSSCKYRREVEEYMVDRMWYQTCTFSQLCNFRVELKSSCDKHEPVSA